jgi:hypothetical protein
MPYALRNHLIGVMALLRVDSRNMCPCVILVPQVYSRSRPITGTIFIIPARLSAKSHAKAWAAKAEQDVFEPLAWLYDGSMPAKKIREGTDASRDVVGLGGT